MIIKSGVMSFINSIRRLKELATKELTFTHNATFKRHPSAFRVTDWAVTTFITFFLLTSCKTVPPGPKSDIITPKKMRTGIQVVPNRCDLGQMQWWKKMHDPVLDKLIAQALANNNQIKNAKANVMQARALLKEAQFAWLPTVNANGVGLVGGGWDTTFTPEGNLARTGITPQGPIHFKGYFGGFVPSYSLNILANMAQDNYANASLNEQKAVYLSARLSVIGQVSGTYFMLLGQKEQLIQQRQYLHDLKEMRKLEWSRYQAGMNDLSMVTSLDQQIANNQATLASTENSIVKNENSIQILLNRNPGPLVAHGNINQLSLNGLIPANVPSAVLKNRPDVIMARQTLKMAEANIGVAYANFFPRISLTTLLGSASAELAHLLSLSTGLWVAEGLASIPILNGVSYEKIKEAKAGYYAAYFNYIQTLKSVFADVDNTLTNQQKMNTAYALQFKALQAAKQNYALNLARYKAGARDFRDVINAQLSVDQAKLNVNAAKMQQLDGIVQVYQALAGGYRNFCPTTHA